MLKEFQVLLHGIRKKHIQVKIAPVQEPAFNSRSGWSVVSLIYVAQGRFIGHTGEICV